MDSPILENIFREIQLDTSAERAIYLQLSDAILLLIKKGNLRSGQKLISSRDLAKLVGINRITVSKAFEELQMQGWLESFVGKGTFVSSHIPEVEPTKLQQDTINKGQKIAGFSLNEKEYLSNPYFVPNVTYHLDDGYPDPKLAPLKELYRAYRNQLTRSGIYQKFGSYGSPDGSEFYKQALSRYLNDSRGLNTTEENILSIRGTLMGINLVCTALIKPGDVVVSGIPGWQRAEHNFLHAKANHIGIPVDEHGLVIDKLKKICKQKKVRMVYVTPHHHYPTTVSLRIDRRLELLRLANEYGFIIFEDDYDFDFHYAHRPLLPLASADENGMVIYCGSFSKSFSPAFRMGYLVASENVIKHLANVRMLLDRQGDHILDNAMAELLNDGTVQRYVRKALTIYEERRDYFCNLLSNELDEVVNFTIPDGGMTVWTKFDKRINLDVLSQKAYARGLYISDGKMHQYPTYNENAIRLGFASSSIEQLADSVHILKGLV
ncbi:GntR family transcriptional regulator / MocR family aminotransferase [Chishuiella changwenlii]|uniref:GntR family transcriptional regulator n=1 Tax=Chishuiella changwenlii TaxID=1434701 RepID=A0A1M6W436_9FLAO|nr:PLP-dependent aminotransferase family protein [Chishuiella changwenlii]GGE89045.1 GntR family transcriptional regulator [Chishuiella changwenlii]SHK88532.1 GntR family transcriptional regulator / MocR family aminotransferase [Chishuiella changwenlii]